MSDVATSDTAIGSSHSLTASTLPFEIELDGKTYPLFDRTSNVDVDCVLPGRVDLVDSDLATLMEELKSHFGIDTDISLEFPSLNGIVFNNNMVWAQQVQLSELATMHSTLTNNEQPFVFRLVPHSTSFVNEYNALIEQVEKTKSQKQHSEENVVDVSDQPKTVHPPEMDAGVPVLIDDSEASAPQIDSTQNDSMQISSVDSPVHGPFINADVTHGNSVEEARASSMLHEHPPKSIALHDAKNNEIHDAKNNEIPDANNNEQQDVNNTEAREVNTTTEAHEVNTAEACDEVNTAEVHETNTTEPHDTNNNESHGEVSTSEQNDAQLANTNIPTTVEELPESVAANTPPSPPHEDNVECELAAPDVPMQAMLATESSDDQTPMDDGAVSEDTGLSALDKHAQVTAGDVPANDVAGMAVSENLEEDLEVENCEVRKKRPRNDYADCGDNTPSVSLPEEFDEVVIDTMADSIDYELQNNSKRIKLGECTDEATAVELQST